MTHFAERRKYQRCDNLVCKIFMSMDQRRWNEIELCDISAGGMEFSSRKAYEVDTHLYFNLNIYNMLSEFNMRAEGHIVRLEKGNGRYYYGVQFDNFNKYQQVQLDELIRSRITVSSAVHKPLLEEEVYAFLLVPNVRSRRNRISSYR